MTKKEFVEDFELAMNEEFATVVRVGREMPDLSELEYVVNTEENYEAKLEYYKKAYDDNMCLKAFNKIKIVTVEFFHSEGGFWSDIKDFD